MNPVSQIICKYRGRMDNLPIPLMNLKQNKHKTENIADKKKTESNSLCFCF